MAKLLIDVDSGNASCHDDFSFELERIAKLLNQVAEDATDRAVPVKDVNGNNIGVLHVQY
jgi:hypothetical protein